MRGAVVAARVAAVVAATAAVGAVVATAGAAVGLADAPQPAAKRIDAVTGTLPVMIKTRRII